LGFVSSAKEGKRKFAEGAVRLNDMVINDPFVIVKSGDKISLGNKKHGIVT
jgi:tyrosyl-tRNA synthetase